MHIRDLALYPWMSCALLLALSCASANTSAPSADNRASARHNGAATNTDASGGFAPDSGAQVNADAGLAAAFLSDAGHGWQSLIQAHWHVPANSETYLCARVTVPNDVALHEFHSLSPPGTHHSLLSLARGTVARDGVTQCDATTNAPNGLFAAGVGTNDFALPDGLAIRVRAGEQLLLNLHLFNSSDQPLEGTSGTLVRTLPDEQVQQSVEVVLAGTFNLEIPPGRNIEQSGSCTMVDDFTLVAVSAHMHKHGVHMKVVAESSLDGTVVLHDGDYSFDSQLIYPIEPVHMKRGDLVKVLCTYDNLTDSTLQFGTSTLDEMCFSELFRYPAGDRPIVTCSQ